MLGIFDYCVAFHFILQILILAPTILNLTDEDGLILMSSKQLVLYLLTEAVEKKV